MVPELSRSAAQRLLEEGLVTLLGKPVRKNYRCAAGDCFELVLPEPEDLPLVPQDIPLDVVFEDSDVIVVNKPRGLVVHPAPGHPDGTLVNALLFHCGDSLSGVGGEKRPGIVHRIDKDTSGLLIAAKNDFAHRALSEQLKDRSLSRTYEAVVRGNLREDAGTVDRPIGRHPTDRKRMAIVMVVAAVAAVLVYALIVNLATSGQGIGSTEPIVATSSQSQGDQQSQDADTAKDKDAQSQQTKGATDNSKQDGKSSGTTSGTTSGTKDSSGTTTDGTSGNASSGTSGTTSSGNASGSSNSGTGDSGTGTGGGTSGSTGTSGDSGTTEDSGTGTTTDSKGTSGTTTSGTTGATGGTTTTTTSGN